MHLDNIFISAGELSGDKYAVELIEAMRETKFKNYHFWGMGGFGCLEAGVEILQDSTYLGSMGADFLKSLFFFWQLERRLLAEVLKRKPKLAIFVDYPGLNLRLAEQIKAQLPQCRTVFLVAPQVWAWNEGRKYKLRKFIDLLLCLLPFEEPLHRVTGTNAHFIGNPPAYRAKHKQKDPIERRALLQALGLDPARKTIIIAPGSRKRELDLMLPILLRSARALKALQPDWQFFLLQAPSVTPEMLVQYAGSESIEMPIASGYEALAYMAAADLAWLTSGTVTLECACLGTPLILGYREFPFFFWVFEQIRLVPWIGLPNIVLGRQVCVELLQDDCVPENWVAGSIELLAEGSMALEHFSRDREALLKVLEAEVDPFEWAAGLIEQQV